MPGDESPLWRARGSNSTLEAVELTVQLPRRAQTARARDHITTAYGGFVRALQGSGGWLTTHRALQRSFENRLVFLLKRHCV